MTGRPETPGPAPGLRSRLAALAREQIGSADHGTLGALAAIRRDLADAPPAARTVVRRSYVGQQAPVDLVPGLAPLFAHVRRSYRPARDG